MLDGGEKLDLVLALHGKLSIGSYPPVLVGNGLASNLLASDARHTEKVSFGVKNSGTARNKSGCSKFGTTSGVTS